MFNDFYRDWVYCINSFGNFWIVLEAIYQLTSTGAVQLGVDMESYEDPRFCVDILQHLNMKKKMFLRKNRSTRRLNCEIEKHTIEKLVAINKE